MRFRNRKIVFSTYKVDERWLLLIAFLLTLAAALQLYKEIF